MGAIIKTDHLFVGGTVREIYVEREEIVNGCPLIYYREVLRNGKLGALEYSTAKSDLLELEPQISLQNLIDQKRGSTKERSDQSIPPKSQF